MTVKISKGRPILEIISQANTGKKIVMLRTLNGWSQQQLAEKIGMSKEAVYAWENGIRNPEPRSIRDVARALDVMEEDLL